MYFKSSTDTTTAVQTPPPPQIGAAGDSIEDPDFGCRIIRFTDENSILIPKASNVSAGIGGSADVNVWNTDETLLYVCDQGGGGRIVGYNPISKVRTMLFTDWRVSGALVFSRLDPNIAFVFSGAQFLRYDLTDREALTPPDPVVVCDFASLLPGGITWRTIGGVEAADTIFTCAFSVSGTQGTGVYACANILGKGRQVYNTATGEITSDFGVNGIISIPDRYTIHNVKASKDGATLAIGLTTKIAGDCIGPMFWTVGTLNVSAMSKVARGGHWTLEYGKFINNSSSASIPNYSHCRRLLTALDSPWAIADPIPNPKVMYGIDDHLTFNGPPDSMFVATTTDNPSAPGKVYPAAWWNEVLGFDLSNGKVYRFCHHFSDTHQKNGTFSALNAIGASGPLNQRCAFTSNWGGTLKDGRADVFVVEFQ